MENNELCQKFCSQSRRKLRNLRKYTFCSFLQPFETEINKGFPEESTKKSLQERTTRPNRRKADTILLSNFFIVVSIVY
jgi:hypothetical protein